MWYVYNAIVESLGLDTVKNLLVNLVLFSVLGLVLGVVVRRVRAVASRHQVSPRPRAVHGA